MFTTPRAQALLVTAFASVGFSLAANAAEPVGTLARITGTAVVNQGAQYVVGREGMSVHEGDRLLVLEGGSTLVTFADGCQYTVQDDELLVVPAVSTCVPANAVADGAHKVAPYNAIAENATAGTAGLRPAQAPMGAAAGGMAAGAAVPAIAAGAVAVGAGADSNNRSDNTFPIVAVSP